MDVATESVRAALTDVDVEDTGEVISREMCALAHTAHIGEDTGVKRKQGHKEEDIGEGIPRKQPKLGAGEDLGHAVVAGKGWKKLKGQKDKKLKLKGKQGVCVSVVQLSPDTGASGKKQAKKDKRTKKHKGKPAQVQGSDSTEGQQTTDYVEHVKGEIQVEVLQPNTDTVTEVTDKPHTESPGTKMLKKKNKKLKQTALETQVIVRDNVEVRAKNKKKKKKLKKQLTAVSSLQEQVGENKKKKKKKEKETFVKTFL